MKKVIVSVIRDEEARVWIATSKNLPALVVESDSLDELTREITRLVPELLALQKPAAGKMPISIQMNQYLEATA